MIAICDERRTVESVPSVQANRRGNVVANEADSTSDGERDEMRWILRVDRIG